MIPEALLPYQSEIAAMRDEIHKHSMRVMGEEPSDARHAEFTVDEKLGVICRLYGRKKKVGAFRLTDEGLEFKPCRLAVDGKPVTVEMLALDRTRNRRNRHSNWFKYGKDAPQRFGCLIREVRQHAEEGAVFTIDDAGGEMVDQNRPFYYGYPERKELKAPRLMIRQGNFTANVWLGDYPEIVKDEILRIAERHIRTHAQTPPAETAIENLTPGLPGLSQP